MKIYTRRDGRYMVKFRKDGGYRQKTFRTEEDAAAFVAELENLSAHAGERLTVMECMTRFLENVPHSRDRENAYLFIVCGSKSRDKPHEEGPAECIADRFVDSLTRSDLELVREKARARGHGVAYINQTISKMKTAFRWAASEDLLPGIPWERYKALKGAKTGSHSGTMEDLRTLWPHLSPALQWAARVTMALCLRPGRVELWGLRWDAFDWEHGRVTVQMGKVGRVKVVYPSEDFMAEARKRFDARKCDQVCPGAYGRTVRDMWTSWKAANASAGTDFPMYALRHISATEMLAAGVDIASVSQMLGHSNPAITAKFYIHSNEARMRAAARTIPDVAIGAGGAKRKKKVK